MRLVLDASITLSWFFRDEREPLAIAALTHVREYGALVPPLWNVEVAHTLVKAERRGRIDQEQTAKVIEYLRALPIVVEIGGEAPAFPQVTLARKFELSAYDATYLDLAIRLGVSLATRDDKLAAAAGALGILWKPARSRRAPRRTV